MRALRPSGRRRGERGAVAVEAALVIPVIMLLVFGMIDMALLMRDYVSVTSGTRQASRLAASQADAGPCIVQARDTTTCPTSTTGPQYVPEVAQNAADSMQRNLTGVSTTDINYMMVYEANKNGFPCTSDPNCNPALASPASAADNNSTMPTTCAGYINCIYFTWSSTALSGAGAFRFSSAKSSTTGWRSSAISACNGKEDSIGVYINVSHQWITKVLGAGPYVIQDKSVMKFEPLSSDSCDSTKTNPHL